MVLCSRLNSGSCKRTEPFTSLRLAELKEIMTAKRAATEIVLNSQDRCLDDGLPLIAGPMDDDEEGGGAGTGVITRTKPKTRKPSLYKVLILNDDYTPMEFVVHILERFFNKGREEATQIMLHVHQNGVGICGIYTYEVAETKVTQVVDFARQNQHPLQCTMERE